MYTAFISSFPAKIIYGISINIVPILAYLTQILGLKFYILSSKFDFLITIFTILLPIKTPIQLVDELGEWFAESFTDPSSYLPQVVLTCVIIDIRRQRFEYTC